MDTFEILKKSSKRSRNSMRPFRGSWHYALSITFILIGLVGEVSARDARLFVLLVLDTDANSIGDTVEIDRQNMVAFFQGSIKEERLSLNVLDGDDATWKNIQKHFERLKDLKSKGNIDQGDTLLFYYSGHGGLSRKGNQEFSLSHDKTTTYSFSVETMMKELGCRLNIVLYDCCSNYRRDRVQISRTADAKMKSRDAFYDEEMIESLFFGSANWVVIASSADGTPSHCGSINGGIFTKAFTDSLKAKKIEHDYNHDKKVDWSEMYKSVRDATNQTNSDQMPSSRYLCDQRTNKYKLKFNNNTGEPIRVVVRSWDDESAKKITQSGFDFSQGQLGELETDGHEPLLAVAMKFRAHGTNSKKYWYGFSQGNAENWSDNDTISYINFVDYNSGQDGSKIKTAIFKVKQVGENFSDNVTIKD